MAIMACVKGWQKSKKRIKIIIEIDKNCLGCKHMDIDNDLEHDNALFCKKHNIAVCDDDCCNEWEITKNIDDFNYLNTKIKDNLC